MFNYCAIVGVWFPGCPLFRGNFVLESAVGSVRSSCPLSGIEKRPFLGGCLSTITIVISFRNKECVRCREVVRFSEGPLSEVRLYYTGYKHCMKL